MTTPQPSVSENRPARPRSGRQASATVALPALLLGAALAWALDRPWVAAATVACHLLPAWFASLADAWRLAADVTVTLDPLDPDPALLAQAFRAAAERAAVSGIPATLCIHPLFDRDGRAVPLRLTLSETRETLCAAGDRIARIPPAGAWLPRHPLPLTVGASPVRVRFTAGADRRLSTTLSGPLSSGASLALHAGLCAILLPLSGPAALAAATALASSLMSQKTGSKNLLTARMNSV